MKDMHHDIIISARATTSMTYDFLQLENYIKGPFYDSIFFTIVSDKLTNHIQNKP